ncbi:MAG: DUF4231 domain-containing protein [Solirubrobacterales bacterium]|nr:DUF4231 domain-containing protein [Solirubrobacterales bacterium]
MSATGGADVVASGPAGRAAPGGSPARDRLEDQIAWYDAQSEHNQHWFKALKVLQIVLAAAIPVAAGVDASSWVVGGAGALIVVLEGLQQLQQYQQYWTTYRSTAERLKHEKFLFLAHAGSYATADQPETLLAERVEGLVSQEHAAWSAQHEDDARRTGEAK